MEVLGVFCFGYFSIFSFGDVISRNGTVVVSPLDWIFISSKARTRSLTGAPPLRPLRIGEGIVLRLKGGSGVNYKQV